MKRFLTPLLMFLIVNCFGQFASFNKTYNFSSHTNNTGSYILDFDTQDSAILFAGVGNSLPVTSVNPVIGKIDYQGNLLWKKNILFPPKNYAIPNNVNCLHKMGTNRYAIWGEVSDYESIDSVILHYPFIYIFNESGDSIFEKVFNDTTENRSLYSATFTSNRHFVIGGIKESNTRTKLPGQFAFADSLYLFFSCYDTTGKLIWDKLLSQGVNQGSINYNYPYNIIPAENGSVVASGSGRIAQPGVWSTNFFIKIDSSGNVIWLKNYKRNSYGTCLDSWVCKGDENSYYFITDMSTVPPSPTTGPSNSLLLYGHIDNNGDTMWLRQFADTGLAYGYKYTRARQIGFYDKKIYLLSYVYYDGYYHPTLVICDSLGNVKSYREYFNINSSGVDNTLFTIKKTQNGNLLMCGYIQNSSPIPGVMDSVMRYCWVIMVDSFGCEFTGCQAIDTIWNVSIGINELQKNLIDIIIYPNPTVNSVNIKTDIISYSLDVYNAEAELIIRKTIDSSINIGLSSYSSGVYYFIVRKGNQSKTFKIIKD